MRQDEQKCGRYEETAGRLFAVGVKYTRYSDLTVLSTSMAVKAHRSSPLAEKAVILGRKRVKLGRTRRLGY